MALVFRCSIKIDIFFKETASKIFCLDAENFCSDLPSRTPKRVLCPALRHKQRVPNGVSQLSSTSH